MIHTLVDITKTNVFKEWIDPLKKKQQDNFQTLHQTLEMRGNIFSYRDPKIITMDWSQYGYGKKEKTWQWQLYTEQNDLFKLNEDDVFLMRQDVNFVPFINECNETAKFRHNVFSTEKKPVNIIFELLDK